MRLFLAAALICLSLTYPAQAQRGGHGGAGRGGAGHAGGGVRSPGFGGSHGGFNHQPAFRAGLRFQRFPRIYPLFYGGFGYSDPYAYSPSLPDPYAENNSDYYARSQAPAVIVNQEFQAAPEPHPMMQECTAAVTPPPPVQQKYEEPLYLVAFHDGVIRAVLAYWIQGASLHYVTMEHGQKQVPLSSIDRGLSERLNGERNVSFRLPH